MKHSAVFDPDHYNIIDIVDYPKYRQHIEEQRQKEIEKQRRQKREELKRKQYIMQKIFSCLLFLFGIILVRFAVDVWQFGTCCMVAGLLIFTERNLILW